VTILHTTVLFFCSFRLQIICTSTFKLVPPSLFLAGIGMEKVPEK